MLITVKKVDDKLHVTSPYNSTFVAKARKLGGKWKDNEWVFDVLAEEPLKAALIDCYGTDGSPEQQIALKIKAKGELSEWRTYVADGSEFILTSIPKSVFERKERWAEYWEAEEIYKPNRKALEEELAGLEARITEIKKELEALDA